MNPVDWLRELGTLVPRPWGRDCPHGSPVPVGPCPDCDAVALTDVEERATVRVSCLSDPGHPAAIRLASAGVLPGAEVTLLQRWPAFVMRLGHAELAMDRETAGMIRVRREAMEGPANLGDRGFAGSVDPAQAGARPPSVAQATGGRRPSHGQLVAEGPL